MKIYFYVWNDSSCCSTLCRIYCETLCSTSLLKWYMRYIVSSFIVYITSFAILFSAAPEIGCAGLPGCSDSASSEADIFDVIGNIISLMIQYIAVLAVLAIMLGWIMYLVSSWDEEKTKRAKNVIIWALVWVFLSITAWSIIAILNNFSI